MPTDEQRAPDDVAAFVAKWEPHATLTGLIPEMCARMEADLRALIASREAAARAGAVEVVVAVSDLRHALDQCHCIKIHGVWPARHTAAVDRVAALARLGESSDG